MTNLTAIYPYHSPPLCRACGGDRVSTSLKMSATCGDRLIAFKHLRRSCECGFEWLERPFDSIFISNSIESEDAENHDYARAIQYPLPASEIIPIASPVYAKAAMSPFELVKANLALILAETIPFDGTANGLFDLLSKQKDQFPWLGEPNGKIAFFNLAWRSAILLASQGVSLKKEESYAKDRRISVKWIEGKDKVDSTEAVPPVVSVEAVSPANATAKRDEAFFLRDAFPLATDDPVTEAISHPKNWRELEKRIAPYLVEAAKLNFCGSADALLAQMKKRHPDLPWTDNLPLFVKSVSERTQSLRDHGIIVKYPSRKVTAKGRHHEIHLGVKSDL